MTCACQHSQLGDYPLGGYSIPHELSNVEAQTFFERQLANPILQDYMDRREPVQGVIVQDGYGEILVWFDASGRLRIIDVTNMSIAREVQKAPFVSDPQYLEALQEMLSYLPTFPQVNFALAALAVGLFFLWRTSKA
jgi:hypothetical protein